ncbi:MAG: hypothetical protein WED09_01760 [Homoserinimonas sp.]
MLAEVASEQRTHRDDGDAIADAACERLAYQLPPRPLFPNSGFTSVWKTIRSSAAGRKGRRSQLDVLAHAGQLAQEQLQADDWMSDEADRPVGLRQA